MTLASKLLHTFRNWRSALFGRPEREPDQRWVHHSFYTEEQRRNEKLAQLARWIEAARRTVDTKKAQKKKHSHIVEAIRIAQNNRLMIETGRMVYDPAFGAWVVKGEK